MAEVNPPSFQTGQCYEAGDFRGMLGSLVCGEGVSTIASGALEVTPVADSFAVSVAAGEAFIEGTQIENQGMYWVQNDGPVVLEVQPSDPTDPRIDLVVATVNDSEFFGTENNWVLQVVQGIASPAPEAPTMPGNSLLLATLNIPAGATSPVQVTDERVDFQSCGASRPVRRVFNSNGTFSKGAYPGASWFEVTVTGAGGGGGGAASGGGGSAAGGGGAGGTRRCIYYPEDLPANVSVTVGQGGNGGPGSGGGDGSAGSASRFGTFITCNGGGGGLGMQAGASFNTRNGGAGGNTSGTQGSAGPDIGARGGSGSAGIRFNADEGAAGDGGDSFWGGGGRGEASSSPGQNGVAGGGGAGGLTQGTDPAYGGGDGGDGFVYVDVH